MLTKSKKIIFIVGPTAVGKSMAACLLAQKIKGEIISCDSMQVYKEVDIASNKPPQKILQKVPHHLINIVSIEEEFNVAKFNELALKAIKDIHKRHHIPLIIGGSGMYMQILLDGIFKGESKDEELRSELKNIAQRQGNQILYDKLKMMDQEAAAKIHPNDLRRIIRALEICLTEKKPLSQIQKKRKGLWGKYDIKIFVLNRARGELYRGIEERVDEMMRHGLVDEIKKLNHIKWSFTADRIIGVREIRGYLNGEYNLEKAVDLMKLNTRHLAKRQLTWFRKDKRLRWIMITPEQGIDAIVGQIFKEISSI